MSMNQQIKKEQREINKQVIKEEQNPNRNPKSPTPPPAGGKKK